MIYIDDMRNDTYIYLWWCKYKRCKWSNYTRGKTWKGLGQTVVHDLRVFLQFSALFVVVAEVDPDEKQGQQVEDDVHYEYYPHDYITILVLIGPKSQAKLDHIKYLNDKDDHADLTRFYQEKLSRVDLV